MARVKNSSFHGTVIYDADIDAPTFTRAVREIQSDLALIYDKLTGENGETVLIDHQGDVKNDDLRGCPLGIPIANQHVGADLTYTSPTGSGSGKNGATGLTYIIAVPVFNPSAEANFATRAEIDVAGILPSVRDSSVVHVMSTAGSVLDTRRTDFENDNTATRDGVLSVDLDLTTGLQILFWEIDTDRSILSGATNTEVFSLRQWRLHPNRMRTQQGKPVARKTTNDISVTAPSATQALAWRDMDAGMFTDLFPLNAYLTAGANRNANGLWEYLTGYPVGNDASYTQVDHNGGGTADDIDPARPRFHGGMDELAGYANMPNLEFPVHSEALGPVMADGYAVVDAYTSGAQNGLIPWQPIIGNRKDKTAVHKAFVAYPDLPASTLKWAVLAAFNSDPSNASGNGPGAWTAYVDTVTTSGSATFTRVGTTDWALATGTGLNFPADENGTCTLSIEKTGVAAKAAAIDEIQILGWCLYFDP